MWAKAGSRKDLEEEGKAEKDAKYFTDLYLKVPHHTSTIPTHPY